MGGVVPGRDSASRTFVLPRNCISTRPGDSKADDKGTGEMVKLEQNLDIRLLFLKRETPRLKKEKQGENH